MTVKTQGGKVITKDGKVSCSCCAEPECCMYPAQELADGLFSSSDLPSSVIIDGIVFSVSGTSYGNTVNGVILEGNVWAKYTNGSRSSRPCLLQGGVEDQFADTYYYSAQNNTNPGESFSNIALNRISLCKWQASASSVESGYLHYVSSPAPDGIRDFWLIGGLGIDGTVSSPDGLRLNTPVGVYNNRFLFSNITIS